MARISTSNRWPSQETEPDCLPIAAAVVRHPSWALVRFGSAEAGDLINETGDALGKLLRSLCLCAYLGNPGAVVTI
jgi:hypothetical protein